MAVIPSFELNVRLVVIIAGRIDRFEDQREPEIACLPVCDLIQFEDILQ